MIVFQNVSKSYNNGHIGLDSVSFKIKNGEFLFVTGHSGAGKSTLLKMLLAIEKPSSGKILFENQELNKINKNQIAFLRRQIGVVFQNHQLLLNRTVAQNVSLPLQILGVRREIIEQKVTQVLQKLELSSKQNEFPANLSTGQQQRVGIARAIVHNPPLLLADEPTGNLDPKLAKEVINIFESINKNGTTVIVASHDLALIARLRHRLITLQKGMIIADKNV